MAWPRAPECGSVEAKLLFLTCAHVHEFIEQIPVFAGSESGKEVREVERTQSIQGHVETLDFILHAMETLGSFS